MYLNYIISSDLDLKKQLAEIRWESRRAEGHSFSKQLSHADLSCPFILALDQDGKVWGGVRIQIADAGAGSLRIEEKTSNLPLMESIHLGGIKRAELKNFHARKELVNGPEGFSRMSRMLDTTLAYCKKENVELLFCAPNEGKVLETILSRGCKRAGIAVFSFGEVKLSGYAVNFKKKLLVCCLNDELRPVLENATGAVNQKS